MVTPSIGVSDSGGCFSWDSPVDPRKRSQSSGASRCCANLAGRGISSRMRDLHAESGMKDLIRNNLRSGKLPPPMLTRSDRSSRFQVTYTRLGQLYASGTVTGYGSVVPRPCKVCPTEHCSFGCFRTRRGRLRWQAPIRHGTLASCTTWTSNGIVAKARDIIFHSPSTWMYSDLGAKCAHPISEERQPECRPRLFTRHVPGS